MGMFIIYMSDKYYIQVSVLCRKVLRSRDPYVDFEIGNTRLRNKSSRSHRWMKYHDCFLEATQIKEPL